MISTLLWTALALAVPTEGSAQPHALTLRVAGGSFTQELQSIDFATGKRISIGPLGINVGQADLAFLPTGELVAVDNAQRALLRIDPSTGAAVKIGDLGIGSPAIFGLTADACGRLWMIGRFAGISTLYRIDPRTGSAEERGTLPEGVSGLAGRGERLFTITLDRAETWLVEIVPEDASLVDLAVVEGLPSSYLPRGLDFHGDATLLEIGLPVPPAPPPGLPVGHQIDLGGEILAETSLGFGEIFLGLAAGPPPGTCTSAVPLAVPAASPVSLLLLALLIGGAGAVAVRRFADRGTRCYPDLALEPGNPHRPRPVR